MEWIHLSVVSCQIILGWGLSQFQGVGLVFSNEFPRDCFQSGNALADNETILHLLTLVLYVHSAAGVFMHQWRELTYILLKFAVWRIFQNKDYVNIRLIFHFFEVFPFCIHFSNFFPFGVKIIKKAYPQAVASLIWWYREALWKMWMDTCGLWLENFNDENGSSVVLEAQLTQLRAVLPVKHFFILWLFMHRIFMKIVSLFVVQIR